MIETKFLMKIGIRRQAYVGMIGITIYLPLNRILGDNEVDLHGHVIED